MASKRYIDSANRSTLAGAVKTAAFAAWLVLGMTPAALADGGILEGTPETSRGCTIYRAKVEPGQTYTEVYGVSNGNTSFTNHGDVEITKGTVKGTVFGGRTLRGGELTTASCNIVDITDSTTTEEV